MFKSVRELCPHPAALNLTHDVRGWNGRHPVYSQCIEQFRPTDIVEVGSWLGHGTLHLAELAKGDVYCVDTWLGGFDHLIHADREDCKIPRRYGYPELYQQWLYNVAVSPFASKVMPIPQTSINGARLLAHAGKSFGMVVIDASHEYDDVYADLRAYSKILQKDGVMVCDDFRSHPGVFHAVLRFAHEHAFAIREIGPVAVLTHS